MIKYLIKEFLNKKMENMYIREPIEIRDEIPIFSEDDFYIRNYEKISADHLNHLKKYGKNPFMDEKYWIECENSTAKLISKYLSKIYKSNNIKQRAKILDVGVGMGRLISRFKTEDKFGLDISKEYIKVAKSKGINVCLSKIEDIPYKENIFEIITCTDVLEHVFDLNLSIKNILKVLKKDGYLIIRVPYNENLKGYLAETCPYEYVHLRKFDEYSLKLQFEKIHNVKVIEWTFTGLSIGVVKHGANFKIYRVLMRIIYKGLKYLNPSLKNFLEKYFYKPNEINMVIKKQS